MKGGGEPGLRAQEPGQAPKLRFSLQPASSLRLVFHGVCSSSTWWDVVTVRVVEREYLYVLAAGQWDGPQRSPS